MRKANEKNAKNVTKRGQVSVWVDGGWCVGGLWLVGRVSEKVGGYVGEKVGGSCW